MVELRPKLEVFGSDGDLPVGQVLLYVGEALLGGEPALIASAEELVGLAGDQMVVRFCLCETKRNSSLPMQKKRTCLIFWGQ